LQSPKLYRYLDAGYSPESLLPPRTISFEAGGLIVRALVGRSRRDYGSDDQLTVRWADRLGGR
jgi:hypothetical protein